MQRVLSFQMARGFSESSEFVTKRMCFSFLFSVGFLSLLCGFLLGRFAAERTIAFRAEKKRLELAGNGLESTEYLQHLLLQELGAASLDVRSAIDPEAIWLEESMHQISEVFSNLSLVHRVVEHKTHVTATVRGSREPDRYVIVSASGEGVNITLELIKALNKIQQDHEWKPRRTIVFCVFFGSTSPCLDIFSPYTQHKIVGYIALYRHVLQGSGYLSISGSEIIRSIVLQIMDGMMHWKSYSDQTVFNSSRNSKPEFSPSMDVPHVAFTLADQGTLYPPNIENKKILATALAQIAGQIIWRLSESLILKWEPGYFNETGFKLLEVLNGNTQLHDFEEKLRATLEELVSQVKILNTKIDATESTKALDVRILNDLLMDLDRALMCFGSEGGANVNWTPYLQSNIPHQPTYRIISESHLNEVLKCYESAVNILHNWEM